MTRHSIAVVGLGVISRFYLAALDASPAARLAAVCDRDPAALAARGGQDASGAVPAYRDHRELLAAGPPLDGVVITVPNDAHAALCADFLRAGVPVCVEKPLALTGAEGAELTALAQASGVPLFTAFHRRYNAAVRALAAGLPRDVPVERVTVRYFERIEEHIGRDRWYLDPARCGGGCVADNGPNAFDLVRLLLGEVTVETARIGYDGTGLDRTATIGLRSVSGAARATVELDWSYPGELKDVTVTLADGSVHHADMLAGHQGFKSSLRHEYAAILADFTARLRGPYRADHGGTAALELVEAAYRRTEVTAC
ncbi:Gfo/Idh/MocA family protein [Streptomyces sp. NPDC088197]|uniref:Gfo/Idh/MocA family protein n=1 Tax=Streptomyces sp. NPDC088197 TaxID=3365840 RepID=UPI0038137F75